MIDIYETWVTDVDIDGFRIDTVKHVNIEFWQEFGPALQAHAATRRQRRLLHVRRGLRRRTRAFMSRYTTEGKLQATLDFGFQARRADLRRQRGRDRQPARPLRRTTTTTPMPTRNAYSLPTFLGNHDMGRIGTVHRAGEPGRVATTSCVARDKLAHALMYLVRGMPVVYYGDEQGFTGDGGDKDARQDMIAEPGRLVQRRRPDRHERHDGRRELRRATRCTRSSAISPRSRPTTRRCAAAPRSTATRRARPASTPSPASTADEGDRVRRRAQQRRDREDADDPDVLGRRRLQRVAGRQASAT